jgi:hypothetical protein
MFKDLLFIFILQYFNVGLSSKHIIQLMES